LKNFKKKDKNVLLFDTTELRAQSSAKMIKLSCLLGHGRVTCVANCLHNLLITDTLIKIPEAQVLISQCKDVVSALHFKAHLIEEFEQKEADIFAKIQDLQDEIDGDSNDPIDEMDDAKDWQLGTKKSKQGSQTHKTLKTTVPTCWNSVLNMFRSLVSMETKVTEILKRIGKPLLCLLPDDIKLLCNLVSFLEDFEKFTLIISEVNTNLSAIPLIRA